MPFFQGIVIYRAFEPKSARQTAQFRILENPLNALLNPWRTVP